MIQRWRFLLCMALLRLEDARARVRMFLSILLRLSMSVDDMVRTNVLFRRMLESNLPVLAQLGRYAS